MMKKRMENFREVRRSRDTAVNSVFLKKYASSLLSVGRTLQEEKPDYILALSRKGPRLLELMRQVGIWSDDIPVISEKAIDFIPPDELSAKTIVVFDDIIILGTTITNLVLTLAAKYDVSIRIVCLAVDIDTVRLSRDSAGTYFIRLDNGNTVPLDYKMPLRKAERFIFCNEIIRSFTWLNKPYDIDFPVFCDCVDSDLMSELLTQSSTDKAYNLTTVYQSNNGYHRYTFLPVNESITMGLFDNIFQDHPLFPQVCKIRAYSDERKNETALVPMITFSISREFLESGRVYSDRFHFCNGLTDQVRSIAGAENAAGGLYRLACYLASYFYGLDFYLRNSKREDDLLSARPSQLLDGRDLLYLFGPLLARVVLNFLDSHYAQTIEALKTIRKTHPSRVVERSWKENLDGIGESVFDRKRSELYGEIEEYISTHLRDGDALTSQMATIFEGLYYSKEIPTEVRVKQKGIGHEDHERLRTGFNYAQMKEILHRHNAVSRESPNVHLRISLALDFLVDAGVGIPLFYERNDEYYERAYRYGEDCLSAKQYGYLIARTTEALFDHMMKRERRKAIPQISFEKMGTVFQEEIARLGLVDVLQDLVDSQDRSLFIAPAYCRHGKILNISDEAYEESGRYSDMMFTDWCESEGIIDHDRNAGGVKYSNRYLEELGSRENAVPILLASDRIARFKSLALMLYYVDRVIDEKRQSEFLIALTTCGDHESYLQSLRELLRLFFKSGQYNFGLPLEKTRAYLQQTNRQTKDGIEEALRALLERPYSAAHSTRHKKKLRENLSHTIQRIEEYFKKDNSELTLLYELSLDSYIEHVRHAYELPTEPQVSKAKEELERLGELSVRLAEILKNSLRLCDKMYSIRMTRAQRIDKRGLPAINRIHDDLIHGIEAWNKYLEKMNGLRIGAHFVGKLPRVSPQALLDSPRYDIEYSHLVLEQVVPQVVDIYAKLGLIYNDCCSRAIWDDKVRRLFPRAREVEKASYRWAIWYDIKDSSGVRNPGNKSKSPIVKKHINRVLEESKGMNDDCRFDLQERDDKFIYIEDADNVSKYLSALTNATGSDYQMFLRFGIISIQDTGNPFYIQRKSGEIDIIENTISHTLAVRLGTYLQKGNIAGMTEEDSYHTIVMTKEVMYGVYGDEGQLDIKGNWQTVFLPDDSGSEEHYVYFPELNKHVGFYVIICSRKG